MGGWVREPPACLKDMNFAAPAHGRVSSSSSPPSPSFFLLSLTGLLFLLPPVCAFGAHTIRASLGTRRTYEKKSLKGRPHLIHRHLYHTFGVQRGALKFSWSLVLPSPPRPVLNASLSYHHRRLWKGIDWWYAVPLNEWDYEHLYYLQPPARALEESIAANLVSYGSTFAEIVGPHDSPLYHSSSRGKIVGCRLSTQESCRKSK